MATVFDRFRPASKEFFDKMRANGVMHFDVDPTVEVWKMRDNVWSMLAPSPGMGGDAWMHLIVGPEKAMLIDTGFGIGNLRGLVEELTDKPIVLVNTHFHGDHAFGNYQFEAAYIHKYDAPFLKDQMDPAARARMVPAAKPDSFYKDEDLVPVKPYEIIPIEDGYVFDLGDGYEMEVCHLPGHAPGGIGIIDKQNRILFSGDAIVSTPTMISGSGAGQHNSEFMTVPAFRDQLEKLVPKMDEFDVLYPGHAILEYPKAAVTDMLELCNAIIADPDSQDEVSESMRGMAKLKVVGLASIAYSDERI